MHLRHLAPLFVCSLFFLAGCPGDDPPGTDSGTPSGQRDAGNDDAGTLGDAGRDDAGSPGDAGEDDAGSPGDGGDDAGSPGDAGEGDAGEDDAGSPGDAGEDDAGAPETPEALAAELCELYLDGFREMARVTAGMAVAAFSRCSSEDELRDLLPLPLPDELCAPGGDFYEVFLEATTGGRVAFDSEKLDRCVDVAKSARGPLITIEEAEANFASMLQVLVEDPDCEGAITPLVAAGETCRQHWDCPEGTRCEAAELDGAELRCLAPAAAGESCAAPPSAGSDVELLSPSPVRTCESGTQCVNHVCVVALVENQPCNPSAAEGSELTCAEGLFCNLANVCAPLGETGDSCANNSHCEGDLRCVGGLCEAGPIPLGEACAPDGPSCVNVCAVCRPATAGGARACLDRSDIGGACEALDHCREGLRCGVDGLCIAGGGLGASCNAQTPCAVGFFCGGLSGVCEADVAVGGTCERNEQCAASGASCVNGVCIVGVLGDGCLNDSDCQGELVCLVAGEEGGAPVRTCQEPPGIGDACEVGHEVCVGGVCEAGTCVAIGGPGSPCVGGRCGLGEYCAADDTCAALGEPGASCSDDEQCRSNFCLGTNTCSAVPADSCLSDNLQFLNVVSFGLLLPLGIGAARRRRRRREGRAPGA